MRTTTNGTHFERQLLQSLKNRLRRKCLPCLICVYERVSPTIEVLWVKRGSESEIDGGNVAAKCNKQARQAPQRMRQAHCAGVMPPYLISWSQSGPCGTMVDLVGMQNLKPLNTGPR